MCAGSCRLPMVNKSTDDPAVKTGHPDSQRHERGRAMVRKRQETAFWRKVLWGLCLFLTVASSPARAAEFDDWLAKTVWPRAKAAGVSASTFEAARPFMRLNPKLPGVGSSAKKRNMQAEFGTPAAYFDAGRLARGAKQGRTLSARHQAALERAERATGVPGRILLAIWGRESNYGAAKIPHNVFEVLASRGFLGPRRDYFTSELIAALTLAQKSGTPPAQMKSSWAGAMGQPQFMPSSYLKHAADGTGDGRADIWGSETDTLMSIANFLKVHGWVAGRDWGFEVRVPEKVSCALEGPDQGKTIKQWQALGITRITGRPFPAHEENGIAYLMMPAGRYGPAFLVTPNFYVLKDYNMSDLYALYVGHMGDRIDYNIGAFKAPWRDLGKMRKADILKLQKHLVGLGYDVGGADGLPGFKTRRSIGAWQTSKGQAATCFPTAKLANSLR